MRKYLSSCRRLSVIVSGAMLISLPIASTNANTQAAADCPTERVGVVTTALVQAGTSGANQPSIISAPYNSPHHSHAFRGEANLPETGSVYGLAYHAASDTLLSGAFLKRFAALGPQGTGAIYATDRRSGRTTLFADINRIAGAAVAGNDPRGGDSDWFHDASTFDSVGFVGLGDIDLSEDQQTLYAVSLGDRKLYQLDASALDGKGSLPVTQFKAAPIPIPSNACSNPADARPMGLGSHEGMLYVGVTCTAQSSVRNGSIGDVNQLKAAVYRFNPQSQQFEGAPAFSTALNYPRGCIFSDDIMAPAAADCFNANWRPWQPDWRVVYGRVAPGNAQQTNFNLEYPQPWLSDVEFDKGDMLLGFRDLNGDRTGYCKGSPDPSENPNVPNPTQACKAGTMGIQQGNGAGDILRACASGSGWTLESNGACGGQRTAGQGNRQGPQGGEYYWNDQGGGGTGAGGSNRGHHQTAMGALLQLPGQGEIVTTAMNPFDYYSGGIEWYGNQQGNSQRRVETYNSKDYWAFGKANGLGDLEWVCGNK
jgi:hypothetical protein